RPVLARGAPPRRMGSGYGLRRRGRSQNRREYPILRSMIVAIAAVSKQTRAIGKDNGLIWDLPADLARFRALSKGHPVIMGRRTWESLPEKHRPLPGRTNIVVTRNADYAAEGAEVVTSIDDALVLAKQAPGSDVIVVMGGGEIYSLALPY